MTMSPVIGGGVLVGQQLPINTASQQSASFIVRAVPIKKFSNKSADAISKRRHYAHVGGINKGSDAIYLFPHGGQLLAKGYRPGGNYVSRTRMGKSTVVVKIGHLLNSRHV